MISGEAGVPQFRGRRRRGGGRRRLVLGVRGGFTKRLEGFVGDGRRGLPGFILAENMVRGQLVGGKPSLHEKQKGEA